MNFLHELVSLIAPLVPLLVSLVWPATTLIVLCWFKRPIRTVITQLSEAKFGESLSFRFGQVKTDIESPERLPSTNAPAAPPPSGARWDKVADLFWLGNDLDWTAQTALRAAPKERIFHGLTQSYHHASQCGLAHTAAGRQLATLKFQVQATPETALDRDWRANFVEQLYQIIRGFSDLAKEQQPDFRPGP